jgi:hypothetical protein
MTLFRIMASVLAIVATLWGIFVAVLVLYGPVWWRAYFTFGPGYVVMLGYYWRALGRPSPSWCRVIWGVSLLVQGTWLVFATNAAYYEGIRAVGPVFIIWWGIATIASLAGLVFDRAVTSH